MSFAKYVVSSIWIWTRHICHFDVHENRRTTLISFVTKDISFCGQRTAFPDPVIACTHSVGEIQKLYLGILPCVHYSRLMPFDRYRMGHFYHSVDQVVRPVGRSIFCITSLIWSHRFIVLVSSHLICAQALFRTLFMVLNGSL